MTQHLLDPDVIAVAMKKSAWTTVHGAREERSGRFIATANVKLASFQPDVDTRKK